MVRQNQDKGDSLQEQRKKTHRTPQGSHKEKALENREHPEGEGYLQGSKSDETKTANNQGDNPRKQKPYSPQSFDRNEGEGQSQKR